MTLLQTSEMTDALYDPLNHLTQNELMEKFNLAFYEGQNLSKTDVMMTFNEESSDVNDKTSDDFLVDYLISEDESQDESLTENFDLDDFVEDFCKNSNSVKDFDTETFTTENSVDDCGDNLKKCGNYFFVNPPFDNNFFENGDYNNLPPVGTIIKNNFDFNNYIRTVPNNDINYVNHDSKNEFGHMLNEKQNFGELCFENSRENQMILTQNDAILNDDPLLSSSNILYPFKRSYNTSESNSEFSDDFFQNNNVIFGLICKWEKCYKTYDSQTTLVRHIEKSHVEIKRGDEFTCFWENCPRKTKPFNARYKLLIHMRVHSGEKPNKCPFKGCSKAFSRLENLKIHQRSHTGERPYLCQFPSCSKSFSNSSDRAKHQRTHFDTKPYACQVTGCAKKYTDPSSLRKHVKNHTYEEQIQLKNKPEEHSYISTSLAKKFFDPSRQKAIKTEFSKISYTNLDHSYSCSADKQIEICKNIRIKQEIKIKLSEKSNRLKRNLF